MSENEANHLWEPIVFKHGPAMKCKTCGFIWQPHMRKPRITCERVNDLKKARKPNKPYKFPKKTTPQPESNPVADTVNLLIKRYGTPGAALSHFALEESLPSDLDAEDPKIESDFKIAEDLSELLKLNSSRLG